MYLKRKKGDTTSEIFGCYCLNIELCLFFCKIESLPLSLLPPPGAPALPSHGTDDVELVVLEGQIAGVDVDDVVRVVDTEDRVRAVPVQAVHGRRTDLDDEQGDEADGEEGGGAGQHHDADQGAPLLPLVGRDDHRSHTIVTSLLASSDTTLTAMHSTPPF